MSDNQPDFELLELVAELDRSEQCRLEIAREYLRLKRHLARIDAELVKFIKKPL